jgi:hypothetical protein
MLKADIVRSGGGSHRGFLERLGIGGSADASGNDSLSSKRAGD